MNRKNRERQRRVEKILSTKEMMKAMVYWLVAAANDVSPSLTAEVIAVKNGGLVLGLIYCTRHEGARQRKTQRVWKKFDICKKV